MNGDTITKNDVVEIKAYLKRIAEAVETIAKSNPAAAATLRDLLNNPATTQRR